MRRRGELKSIFIDLFGFIDNVIIDAPPCISPRSSFLSKCSPYQHDKFAEFLRTQVPKALIVEFDSDLRASSQDGIT